MSSDEIRWNLPFPVFESHFHALHLAQRGLDPRAILDGAFSRGLAGAVDAAVDEHRFAERLALARDYPLLRLSAGVHPSESGGDIDARMETVAAQAADPAVTALGETGLDFFRDYADPADQEEAFRRHLSLSRETGLPVIIHCREADDRVHAVIASVPPAGGVMHCFSSDWDSARKALDAGLYVSFAGNLTYKKSDDIRGAAARVPLDRLLIETDAPYLSPQEVRRRPNHPGHLGYTLSVLAEVRGENPADVARACAENGRRLFFRD